jgi:AraC-like DNA-binding protein
MRRMIHLGETRSFRDLGTLTVSDVAFAPWTELAPHRHERPQLSLLLRGEMLEAGTSFGAVHVPSSALFRPAGYCHHNTFYADTRGLVIEVDERHRLSAALRDLTAPASAASPQLLTLGRRIRTELAGGAVASGLALEGLVLEFAAAFLRSIPPRWLADVQASIAASRKRTVDVDALAARHAIEASELEHSFAEHAGCTPAEYARRCSIERAKELLATTRMTLAEIAVETGFFDQAHFTRAFRKATGTTPSRFGVRRQSRRF